jgi:dihydropteroate synthase
MKQYFRPLLSSDLARPAQAVSFGHSPFWFDRVEVLSRGSAPQIVSAQDIPQNALAVLSAPRPPIAGLNFNEPVVMGILNVTPDSFWTRCRL